MSTERPLYYTLDADKQPVPMPDRNAVEWALWWEKEENRVIAQDQIGDFLISTIFTGINMHPWRNDPSPMFETVVFRGSRMVSQHRVHAYEDAMTMHRAEVRGSREMSGKKR